MSMDRTKIEYCPLTEVIATATKECDSSTLLFCIDANIEKHYPKLVHELKEKFPQKKPWITKPGEATKTWGELQRAAEFFLAQEIHRDVHLIAIGGGACTDFAGLLAATLLRGLSWSNIPTTLLAMVDAAIGGKTAINSISGKNLFGAFHLPTKVTICEEFLSSLPGDHLQSGLGEVVKYGLLSTPIYDAIHSNTPHSEVYAMCAQHKQDLVALDFKEQGPRKSLNLGHTIGHGLEKMYAPPHGIAVFWGLVLEHRMFGHEKIAEETLHIAQKLGIDGKQFSIPVLSENEIETLVSYVSKDKKLANQGRLGFAICSEIGSPIYPNCDVSELKIKFSALFKSSLSSPNTMK